MLTVAELADRRLATDELAPWVVVSLDDADGIDRTVVADATGVVADVGGRTAVVVGVARQPIPPLLDLLLDRLDLVVGAVASDDRRVVAGDVDALLAALAQGVDRSPLAAVTLVTLLRQPNLAAESFAYSMLLAGPEFAGWLGSRTPRAIPSRDGRAVCVTRSGRTLEVTLADPERRNAFGRRMRDELVEALALLDADDSIEEVHLRGQGPAFCSGGDLDEFGTTPDPATAHVIRTTRSVPWLLQRHRDRIHAHVHGACIGAGTELAAFAGRVTARPDAVFQLPEVAMGLIPGAGGTVSVTARIGRWRTAYLALSGARLDAATALAWGLVDEVVTG